VATRRSFPDRGTVRRHPPETKPLYAAVDHGHPLVIRQTHFAPASRSGSWGRFAESFIQFNEHSLAELDVQVELVPGALEPAIRLVPGARAGAVPLRSAQTGSVVAGLVVKPRFGWSGVGTVMSETGWAATPNFLDLPLVPGSARQVPPWVLAGPVLFRLQSLLASITHGYSLREEVRASPRGSILWPRYVSDSVARGAWHRLPCRYPDLSSDPILRGFVRWAVERVRSQLLKIGQNEIVAAELVVVANRLLDVLVDVQPKKPRLEELDRAGTTRVQETAIRSGLQAIGWILDERGLGGGCEMDGLAWQLPLERLWERYVEAKVRDEVVREGGDMSVGRLGQTVFPLHWSTNTARSMTHLIPDIVVRRGKSIRIVDAKYKAHFADLDEHTWMQMSTTIRDTHRADVHQVLAYASLYDAEDVTATLVYPLRLSTWEALRARRRDAAFADLFHGSRRVRLELRGIPFGRA
jgi:hypothetical protein